MWTLILLVALLVLAIPISFVLAVANTRRLNAMADHIDELSRVVARLSRGEVVPAPPPARRAEEAHPWESDSGRSRSVAPTPVSHSASARETASLAPTSPPSIASPQSLPPVTPPTQATSPPTTGASHRTRPLSTPAATASAASRSPDLESILGSQWLTWIGVLALFLGSGFFLGVDLGDSPLSGLPQVVIGLLVACGFNLVGRYWSGRRERLLGLGLLGGGVGLLYLAAYASYGFHHLVPLWLVFPLLLVVATVGAALALDRNSLVIASLTLTGALLTPVVLGGGNDTYGLLPYLVAVNLGAVLVGLRRGWAGLPLASFLATLLLILGWWNGHYEPSLRAFAFFGITGSWLVFAVAPWLWRGTSEFWSALRGIVLAGNGLVYAVACYHLLSDGGESWRGLMLISLAATYLSLSRWMQRRQGPDPATRLTHMVGVALAALFVPVQLHQAWITPGWLALATILVHAGLRERDAWHRVSGLAVLVLVTLRSLVFDLPQAMPVHDDLQPVLNGEFLAGLCLVAVLVWLARAYRRQAAILTREESNLLIPLQVAAVCVGAWKLSAELLWFFEWRSLRLGTDLGPTGPLYLGLLWAVYGAVTLVGGVRSGNRALRLTGDGILAAALGLTALLTLVAGVRLAPDYRPVLNLPFLQGAAIAVILGAVFWWLRRRGRDAALPANYYRTPLLLTGVLLLFVKLSAELVWFFEWRELRLGTDLGLTGPLYLSLFWALFGAFTIVGAVRLGNRALRFTGDGMLAASVAMTVLMTVGAGTGLAPTYRPLLNLPFLQGAAIAVVLSGVFWWFHREGRDSVVPAEYYRSPLLLTAILLLFLKVSFEVESYFTLGDAARAGQGVKSLLTLSVVWGLYAGAVIVSGFLSRYKPLRLLGISLLALTVFKVFLLDVQALDRGYRIVAFLVLGVLSLGISMLYQQERKGVPGGTRKDETLPDRPGKPE